MYLRKGQKCDVRTLTEIYGDEGVANSILESAKVNKTVSRIESGDLTLPEPHDAFEYHQRLDLANKGVDDQTAELLIRNPKLHGMFSDFERRLSVLEGNG